MPILHVSKRNLGEVIEVKFVATEGESLDKDHIETILNNIFKPHGFTVELTPPKDSELLTLLNFDHSAYSTLVSREYAGLLAEGINALKEHYEVLQTTGRVRSSTPDGYDR